MVAAPGAAPWALIIGSSSGFGEATSLELAKAGLDIFGVHFDRRSAMPHVNEVIDKIKAGGRDVLWLVFRQGMLQLGIGLARSSRGVGHDARPQQFAGQRHAH